MAIRYVRADITTLKVDAIVNSANPFPVIGGGTDSSIYKAAGKEKLLAERKKIGSIDVGDARATSGFGLCCSSFPESSRCILTINIRIQHVFNTKNYYCFI